MSIWHWLIVMAVVLLLFGGGKRLSSTMADLGRGLRVFRKEVGELQSDDQLPSADGITTARQTVRG